MNKKRMITAVVLGLVVGTVAQAQGRPPEQEHGRGQPDRGSSDQRRPGWGQPDQRQPEQGRPGGARADRGGSGHYDNRRNDGPHGRPDIRGAGPGHDLYRGRRLPEQYRSRQYVVDDWRGYGLRQPPRGYHWVQTGGDYVLVALTTGIILDVLLNN